MEKTSFLIYLDYEEQFNLLTDEQLGKLIKSIIKYEKSGEIPQLDGMLKMAFSFMKSQLDRDREKWSETKQKRSEAGKKGAYTRWGNESCEVIEEKKSNNESIITDSKDSNAINEITNDSKDSIAKNDISNYNKNSNAIDEISNDKKDSITIKEITKIADNVDVVVDDNVEEDVKDKKKNKKEKGTNIKKFIDTDDPMIENFKDENLKNTLKDFIKMRKAIKKPLTERALELIIRKLYKFSTEVNIQIQILEKSIINNWQDIFPLRETDKSQDISAEEEFLSEHR